MRYSKILSSFLLILVIFTLIVPPPSQTFATSIQVIASERDSNTLDENTHLSSYDNILNLLKELETGDLEERCSLEELQALNCYIASLALQGMLPNEEDFTLEDDIQELLSMESNPYGYAYSIYERGTYAITPAIFYGQTDIQLCKSFWRKTKHFVSKHKKAIIIGAAIVVAAAVIGIAVAASAAAAGAATSAPEPYKGKAGEGKSEKPVSLNPSFTQAVLEEEISSLKEFIHEEHFFETNADFSLEENGRVLGQALAHQGLENKVPYFSNSYLSELKTKSLDQAFFSHEASPISVENLGMDFRENAYHLRGERSLELHCNDQAISDLGRAIEYNPDNHRAYLARAIAYEELGDHEHSLADYQQYTEKKSAPLGRAIDFSFAFAKGVPRGVKESGKQLGTLASNLMIHPIDTAGEVCKAFAILGKLAYSQEWAIIAETLTPEVCELATLWDTLSPEEQGDRSGYIFGKYGTDILIPGTLGNLVPKGVRLVRELSSAQKILGTAERTLAFETGQSVGKLHISTIVTLETQEQIIANMDKFAEAGRAMDRASLTKAGRGLMKHGYRDGSVHPKPVGTIAEVNKLGQEVLESILNHPEKLVTQRPHPNFGKVIDIMVPEKGGVRFTSDGKMIGFLEPLDIKK